MLYHHRGVAIQEARGRLPKLSYNECLGSIAVVLIASNWGNK